MVKKIVGDYTLLVSIELDKKTLDKNAKKYSTSIEKSEKKRQSQALKALPRQAKKEADVRAKESTKAVNKQIKKGRAFDLVQGLVSNIGGIVNNIPFVKTLAGLTGAVVARVLTSDPRGTLKDIRGASGQVSTQGELSNLTGFSRGQVDRIVKIFERAGLSFAEASSTLQSLSRIGGGYNTIFDALNKFNKQTSIIGRESVAKAYNIPVNVLNSLSTRQKTIGLSSITSAKSTKQSTLGTVERFENKQILADAVQKERLNNQYFGKINSGGYMKTFYGRVEKQNLKELYDTVRNLENDTLKVRLKNLENETMNYTIRTESMELFMSAIDSSQTAVIEFTKALEKASKNIIKKEKEVVEERQKQQTNESYKKYLPPFVNHNYTDRNK